jgi:hypothetical protein
MAKNCEQCNAKSWVCLSHSLARVVSYIFVIYGLNSWLFVSYMCFEITRYVLQIFIRNIFGFSKY